MSGRHSTSGGRKKRSAVWAYLATFVLLAAGVGATFTWLDRPASGCAEVVELSVHAAPAIAPAVTEYVRHELPRSDSDARCVRPVVRARESSDVADARNFQAGSPDRPDVWIPESSVWLGRARQHTDAVPDEGLSIASSPVVLAATEPIARAAGWPSVSPSWPKLLSRTGDAGTPDPSTNTASAFALMGLEALDMTEVQRGYTIQTLTRRSFSGTQDAFQHLPTAGADPAVSVFPTSEQAVLQHDGNFKPGEPCSVVAGYLKNHAPWLDYPSVVINGLEPIKREAAYALVRALREPAATAELTKHGFRDSAGNLSRTSGDIRVRADAGPIVGPPNTGHFSKVLQSWATFASAARLVVALDVSGSMKQQVPGTPYTRMQVAGATVSEALNLLRANTQLTMWEFSTERDGKLPYRELAPWKPMQLHRADKLPQRIPQLISGPDGFTGLYDTTLAAYKEAREGWDPAMINLVLIVTDGQNDFPAGLTRKELLTELGALADPDKPLQLVFVGLGTDVNPTELKQIADVTGGQVHISPKISNARQLFFTILRGLSSRR